MIYKRSRVNKAHLKRVREMNAKESLKVIRWMNDGFPPSDWRRDTKDVIEACQEIVQLRKLLKDIFDSSTVYASAIELCHPSNVDPCPIMDFEDWERQAKKAIKYEDEAEENQVNYGDSKQFEIEG